MEPDLSCEATGFGDGGAGLCERCSEGDCVAPPGLVTAPPVELDVEVLRELLRKLSDQLQASSHRVMDEAMMRVLRKQEDSFGRIEAKIAALREAVQRLSDRCNSLESKLLRLGILREKFTDWGNPDGGPRTKSEEEGRQKTS